MSAGNWFQTVRGKKMGRSEGGFRRIRLEALEARELLSVSAADYEAIRLRYGDLNLTADYAAINIIELEELSARSLQKAVDAAGVTRNSDLIVVDTDIFATASLMIMHNVFMAVLLCVLSAVS